MPSLRPCLPALAVLVTLSAAPARAEGGRVPAPYRWQGKARVKLTGPGLAVDVAAVPASCGAYFVQDAKVMGREVKAGEGHAFEVRLPEGTFQLSTEDAGTGVRDLGPRAAHRTGAVFNATGGGSFTPPERPGPGDRVEIGADHRSAKVRLKLKKLFKPDVVEAAVDFDCH